MRAGVLTFLVRETRGALGRAAFLVVCVAIGVAAVVTVASLSEAVRSEMRGRSRELLGADLAIEARRPLPKELDDALLKVTPNARRTDVREMASMVALSTDAEAKPKGLAGLIPRSRLAELKVIQGAFPLHGELLLEPPGTLGVYLTDETVVCAPELLQTLGAKLGDTLKIGGQPFRIAATVLEEPDRLEFSLALGPRVFMSQAGLERTSLMGVGNRVKYRTLLALSGNHERRELDRLEDALEAEIPGGNELRISTHFDSQRGVQRGLERLTSYLGLVALLSLVLGGIGVAQVVRAWLGARTRDVAVWRSLGLTPGEILRLFLLHVLLLAALGSALGVALGGAAPWLAGLVAPDLFASGLAHAWPAAAVWRGLGLGLGVAFLFALPALTAVWRVPPALVLRADAVPLNPPRSVQVLSLVLLGVGLYISAWWQAGDVDVAGGFLGGLAGVGLVLWLGAKGLLALVARVPRWKLPPSLTHSLASLARPGAGTIGAVVSLGLGTLVVTTISLVESELAARLDEALPSNAPSVFMVDIQPDQWPGVQAELNAVQATSIDSLPVIMARLAAIDGVPVSELLERPRDGGQRLSRWRLTREQRLTWFETLPESNRLVEGALWSDPAPNEISLEENFASEIGATIGTELTFDVQGLPLDFVVTSLRSIEWESFAINFFLSAEPGSLEGAPGMRLAAARVAPEQEATLQDHVVAAYPNVTMLRVRPILEKVGALMERLAMAVRFLGGFAIVAGLFILAGTVTAANLRRAREVALWKTLGLTRGGIARLFMTEFMVIGALAGSLGACGAYAFSWAFVELVLDFESSPSLAIVATGIGVSTALAVAAGLAASARALTTPPARVLRSE